ncbi:MAG: LysE family transporter [Anaerolineae bacterium]|nr:LysE family transporter [Anaerolineae bacterium]
MLEMLVSAFVLGVAVAIPVGPVSIAAGRRAITLGFRPALLFNLGSLTSDGLYVLLVYVGLAPLLAESAALRLVLWGVGGAWLCWLGLEAIRTRLDADVLDGAVAGEAPWRSYTAGVGITLFNPLTIAGWVALAGSFFAGWDSAWGSRVAWGWLAMVSMLVGVMRVGGGGGLGALERMRR